MQNFLFPGPCALFTIPLALSNALCPMHYSLFLEPYALSPIHCALFSTHSTGMEWMGGCVMFWCIFHYINYSALVRFLCWILMYERHTGGVLIAAAARHGLIHLSPGHQYAPRSTTKPPSSVRMFHKGQKPAPLRHHEKVTRGKEKRSVWNHFSVARLRERSLISASDLTDLSLLLDIPLVISGQLITFYLALFTVFQSVSTSPFCLSVADLLVSVALMCPVVRGVAELAAIIVPLPATIQATWSFQLNFIRSFYWSQHPTLTNRKTFSRCRCHVVALL